MMLLVMLLAPLAGAILNGLILRPTSSKRAGVIATLFALISFASVLCQFFIVEQKPVEWTWFEVGSFSAKWSFTIDSLSGVMFLVVTGIGSLIHIYSIGYMSHERNAYRYFAYLNFFLFNMLALVSSTSLLGMFVGWEGVGLCSYLLIGYWFEDPEKAKAGMKAFIVNRIGDAGFLIGMFICYKLFQTLDFQQITKLLDTKTYDLTLLNCAAFCLFIGAMGKSAQIPLYVWLPDAMAGPTPVSALIHAATMVTAGIYMICRLNGLFMVASDTSLFIACIGGATALLAALIATSQKDIKKVLAYSTVSQLGLMFLALGCKAYFAAFFHVLTHAFFKALLFLGSGSVIHALEGEQDITHMGGLKKKLPSTFITFTIGTIAIAGIPPLAGFFSKDTILYSVLTSERYGMTFWLLAMVVSFLTAFYMTRVWALTFLGTYRGDKHPHESPPTMLFPLYVLAFGSVVAGFLGMPEGLHLLPNYLAEFLSPVLGHLHEGHGPIGEEMAMGIATVSAFIACGIGYYFYSEPKRSEGPAKALSLFKTVFENKFWVDEWYGLLFIKPFEKLCSFLADFFDPKIVDGLVLLPTKISRGFGSVLSVIQTGVVQTYLLIFVMGLLAVLIVLMKGLAI